MALHEPAFERVAAGRLILKISPVSRHRRCLALVGRALPTLRVARLAACGGPANDTTPLAPVRRQGSETEPLSAHLRPTAENPVTEAELFIRYQPVLQRHVAAVVNTSGENVEDACMFAWTKLLSRELKNIDIAYSWLATVAIREALRIKRRSLRTSSLVTRDDEFIGVVASKDQVQLAQLLADAGDVVRSAGLSPRQRHVIGLQVLGLSFDPSPRTPATLSARSSAKSCAPGACSPARSASAGGETPPARTL